MTVHYAAEPQRRTAPVLPHKVLYGQSAGNIGGIADTCICIKIKTFGEIYIRILSLHQ